MGPIIDHGMVFINTKGVSWNELDRQPNWNICQNVVPSLIPPMMSQYEFHKIYHLKLPQIINQVVKFADCLLLWVTIKLCSVFLLLLVYMLILVWKKWTVIPKCFNCHHWLDQKWIKELEKMEQGLFLALTSSTWNEYMKWWTMFWIFRIQKKIWKKSIKIFSLGQKWKEYEEFLWNLKLIELTNNSWITLLFIAY